MVKGGASALASIPSKPSNVAGILGVGLFTWGAPLDAAIADLKAKHSVQKEAFPLLQTTIESVKAMDHCNIAACRIASVHYVFGDLRVSRCSLLF